MLKKWLSLVLVLVCAFTAVPLVGLTEVFAADWQDVLTYEKINKEIKITDCKESASGSLSIPAKIDGLPVTCIGECAFENCVSLKSITIPNCIRSIEDNAFYNCSSLTAIKIPDSVTNIGSHAFNNCTSLSSISLSGNLKNIGIKAFYKTAYYNNTKKWVNNTLYIAKYLIQVKTGVSGKYAIKAGTPCVAAGAFSGCKKLAGVTIPNSIATIDSWTFENCASMKSVTVPNSVKTIRYSAFAGCTSLKTISLPDSLRTIEQEAFLDTAYYNNESNWQNGVLYIGKHLIEVNNLFTSYTIKKGTVCIAEFAFSLIWTIKNVTLPDSLKSIGVGAFCECESLQSITIPSGVSKIGGYTFDGCTSLKSVKIPNSVREIGWYAFHDCSALKSVTVPSEVTKIESHAFGFEYFNDQLISGFSMKCYAYSMGEKYAKANKIKYTSYALKGVSVKSAPTKKTYTIGKSLDTAGLTLTAAYSDNTKHTIYGGFTCSPTKFSTIGTKKITVTYGKKTAAFTVKVVPAVPASFTAAKAGSTSVKTSWKAVSGASGYEVWMATSSGGSYSKLTATTKTTYTKTKLTKNKTYYFKARAYKIVGKTKVYGAFTSVKSAKPS